MAAREDIAQKGAIGIPRQSMGILVLPANSLDSVSHRSAPQLQVAGWHAHPTEATSGKDSRMAAVRKVRACSKSSVRNQSVSKSEFLKSVRVRLFAADKANAPLSQLFLHWVRLLWRLEHRRRR